MSKRRTHSPEFKAKVAMEAISGRKTIQEIAADHAIHPIQVSQWKRQLLDGASELFTRGQKTKDKVGLPRFGGQASGLHGCECTGVDGLLLVVDRAEVANR
ncbi:MAG: transposase [Synechococcaceae cyanobacterium ELA739]